MHATLYYIVTIIVVSFILFVVLNLAAGDPTTVLLGLQWTPQAAAALRERLGLNDPLYVQYARYLWNALHGDLGRSWLSGETVLRVIMRRLPYSIMLASASMVIVLGVGVPLGILSAVKRGKIFDWIARSLSISVSSIPTFWFGIMLIIIFSVELGWLPTGGAGGFQHIVLPAIAVASYFLGATVRMTRGYMLDVLSKDYIVAARAKGLSERAVAWGHAFRNVSLPLVTLEGMFLARMIGSVVIIEIVFQWPGLGDLAITALLSKDIPLALGTLITVVIIYVTVNTLVDVSYRFLDPRLHL